MAGKGVRPSTAHITPYIIQITPPLANGITLSSRITQIRRRKISVYQEALGPLFALQTPAGEFSDFDYVTQLSRVAHRALPGLALEVGSRRRLTDLGLLGHVIMSCGTLRAALDIWLRYADMAGEPVKITSLIEVQSGAGVWTLQFTPLPFLSLPVADFLSDELCASFFAFARSITTRDLSGFEVQLTHPAEAGVSYARYFPGKISFGSSATRLVGPADILEVPVTTRDADTHSLLLDHFATEARDHGLAKATTTGLLLRHYFLHTRSTRPKLADAAAALRMSKRTLNRKLTNESTSYGKVLADHRRAYAIALLREGTLQTKQIAHALGLRNENSLRRAFRAWTGQPIGRRRSSPFEPR